MTVWRWVTSMSGAGKVNLRQTRRHRSAAFRPQKYSTQSSAGFLQSATAFGRCCGLKAALLCRLAECLPGKAIGSSCNLLSQRHMDTLHCSLDVGGSAAQFNSSVSAMPPPPSRTFETPVHSGTADTLLLRSAKL